MNDQQANALFEQSIALLQQGKTQDALKLLVKLDQAIPSNPGILFFTATGLSISGNKHKAIQTYERVLRLNPHFIEAYNNIALDLAYLGEHQRAISFIDQALALKPDFVEAIDNKGCFLNALGEYQQACNCFEIALLINPNDTIALANLSVALRHLGDYSKAKSVAETLLQINPSDYKGHNTLGKISYALEEHESALLHFQTAHNCNPEDADTLADLGSVYEDLGKHGLALEHFDKALAINPDHGATHLGLGLLHFNRREFNRAIEHFSAPIQDKYRLTLREYNRALSNLHSGKLDNAWLDYAYRWKESNLPVAHLDTQKPLWAGQKTDQPILIWHEQGLGDQILFGSLLKEASQFGSNLIVRIDARLLPLFQRSFPSIQFISSDTPVSDRDFEYHLPIGDLARIFRPTFESLHTQPKSYLHADENKANILKGSIETSQPIIGLAWLTKGKHAKDRNLPIDNIVSRIHSLTPSTFIDLQYSDTSTDRLRISNAQNIHIRHLDEINNFTDIDSLAALIAACDLIVTCSNSTAHLAGALGKETYLLVPFGRGRHWYWSHIGENGRSLWYPSIQVIPQSVAGDWTEPLQTLEQRLKARPKLD